MEDETKTCFDCDFAYYSSKDDKWYCWHPREVDREVDPNSSVCSCFYEVEEEKDEEDKTCGDCEYAYFGLDGKDYCEWHGEIDLDDLACSWFHALPDMEER